MAQERLKDKNSDLLISNGQTDEEHTDDEFLIPRNSSVIVRQVLSTRVKPAGRKFIVDRSDSAVVGSSRPKDSSSSMSLAQLAKTANLVDAKASEEDKIRAMMSQSNHEYESLHYSKKAVGPPPAHYICHRCGKAGHYIRQCPMLTVKDKSGERAKPVRISKGIPQSFMVKAEPGTKGAMLTSTGEFAIPAIDATAYAKGKKERPPFVPYIQSTSEDDSDPIPYELLCPICNELMQDAAIIPCCRNSYCDDCIRTALLDSEEHICITCKQSDVSPDSLNANTFLRQAIDKISTGIGWVYKHKQTKPAALSPPSPQFSRPAAPQSQVQPPAPTPLDPPVAATATPAAAAPTPPQAASGEGPDVSPAPSPVPDQHSPMHSTTQVKPPPPWSYRGRGDHPPAHLHTAPPPGPAPQVYPPPSLYMPPSQPYPPPSLYPPPPKPYPPPSPYSPPPQHYPPPYTSGLIPPPPIGYPPWPIYAPGPPRLNPPWISPGVQPPLAHLGPSFSQPPPSKEDFSRQRHQQDKSRSNSRSPFSRSPYTLSRLRSRSRSYSYSPSRARSRSRSHGRSFPRSPYSRHNERSYRRSRSRSPTRFHDYRHSGSPQCPPPLRAGPWEGAEGQGPFRSRSCSPGGFRSRSPGGRRPPPRELASHELKGPSPGGRDRWDRERYQQVLSRDYSPQGRGRRGREERGDHPHNPPSSYST